VAFSPDGQRLFSKDSSGKMLVWNPRSGERLANENPPAEWSGRGAQSPAGKVLALGQADGSIDVVKLRPPSDTDVLYRRWKSAFDPVWQEQGAARHEKAEQWFAAAFHLVQLHRHAAAGDEAAALRVRRLRALTLLGAADAKPLQVAVSKYPADKADATEQVLADLYHTLDWPAHAVPWWLGRDAHAALLHSLRTAEARGLLGSGAK
jgi:hypothetical protein